MKYTIKSLAEELNLSRNTVAKVLSGKSGVSSKTKKLVLEKIEQLEQSTPEKTFDSKPECFPGGTILLVMQETSRNTDFHNQLLKALEQELSQTGYHLTFAFLKPTAHGLPDYDTSIKGIILADPKDPAICELLLKLPAPASVIDLSGSCLSYKGRLDLVTLDTTAALQQTAALFQSNSIQNVTIQAPVRQLGIAAVRCVTDRIKEPTLPYVFVQYIPSLVFGKTTERKEPQVPLL